MKKPYDVHKEVKEWWDSLEPKIANAEEFGRDWLEAHGFEYVYWFGEHVNTKRRTKLNRKALYRYSPFDYYAEKDGQLWFIDATTMCYKDLNLALIKPFMRFAKVAVLFVKRDGSGCILKVLKKPVRTVYLSKSDVGLPVTKWSPNSAIAKIKATRPKFLKAKKLVEQGMSITKACQIVGINRDTYARHRDMKFKTISPRPNRSLQG